MTSDATPPKLARPLGELLISELGRRGLRGVYFDYDAYQTLKLVADADSMQSFLDAHGFESVLAANDPDWLADGLAEAAADKTPPWWTQLEVVSIVTFPVWLLTRLRRKKRTFPRRRLKWRLRDDLLQSTQPITLPQTATQLPQR